MKTIKLTEPQLRALKEVFTEGEISYWSDTDAFEAKPRVVEAVTEKLNSAVYGGDNA